MLRLVKVQVVVFLVEAPAAPANEVDGEPVLHLHPEPALVELVLLWPKGDLDSLGLKALLIWEGRPVRQRGGLGTPVGNSLLGAGDQAILGGSRQLPRREVELEGLPLVQRTEVLLLDQCGAHHWALLPLSAHVGQGPPGHDVGDVGQQNGPRSGDGACDMRVSKLHQHRQRIRPGRPFSSLQPRRPVVLIGDRMDPHGGATRSAHQVYPLEVVLVCTDLTGCVARILHNQVPLEHVLMPGEVMVPL
mmetsp:Transcript_98978/g.236183  ORF Transcript_98978/g.236183 Transcript_98978/m.236183 type:complete len:247 (+) Transcript_98978:68-808(+)